MPERITEAAMRLQDWLAGTFAYKTYRGRAPDGVPQLRSDVRLVVDAALSTEPGEAEGWKPIESAPTNRAILIHVPNLDYYGNDGVYAGMLVDMGTGRRWMTFGWAIGRDLGAENTPDRWQDLPAAPTSEGSHHGS